MHEKQSATPFDAALFGELERLRAENAALRAQVAQLLQRVQDLEARLAKDSHKSSKPPSSDPPFNPGATMGLVDEPDRTVFLPLTGHCDCGCCRAGILASALPEGGGGVWGVSGRCVGSRGGVGALAGVLSRCEGGCVAR